MLSQWQFSNILAGAASVQLFGPRVDYRSLIAEVYARAAAEQSTVEDTLKRHMRERVAGQLLMTGACLSALVGAVVGAAEGWSNLFVVPLALVPSVLLIGVAAMYSRSQLRA